MKFKLRNAVNYKEINKFTNNIRLMNFNEKGGANCTLKKCITI